MTQLHPMKSGVRAKGLIGDGGFERALKIIIGKTAGGRHSIEETHLIAAKRDPGIGREKDTP
jgi:hypothetical protein